MVLNKDKGNIPDYLYVDGEYIYKPLSKLKDDYDEFTSDVI